MQRTWGDASSSSDASAMATRGAAGQGEWCAAGGVRGHGGDSRKGGRRPPEELRGAGRMRQAATRELRHTIGDVDSSALGGRLDRHTGRPFPAFSCEAGGIGRTLACECGWWRRKWGEGEGEGV